MKRREAITALVAGALILMALLAVFAVDLANTQAKSRSELESQAHQRAQLVAGLLDGVFATLSQPNSQLLNEYSRRHVSSATLDHTRGSNEFVAVLSIDGRVLAHSSGLNAVARAELRRKGGAVATVQAGLPWAIGNVLAYDPGGVIDLATRLQTRSGIRILVNGLDPLLLSRLVLPELVKVPGVSGAHHYLLDGNGVVIASTNAQRPTGYLFHTPRQLDVLNRRSGVINGHYFDQVRLGNTPLRVLLSAPEQAFFASVSGFTHWLPWAVFSVLAFVTLLAFVLARNLIRTNDLVITANAALARTNIELERRAFELSRSNAELEQFASIASHDLQEPLRKVRTFTERVEQLESDALSDRGLEYLRRANSSAARMQQLIEDLLVFSRVAIQARRFEQVDLGQVTRDVIEDLNDLVVRTQATVTVGELPTVMADPPQMRQLVQNLISNALKFNRERTPPEVEVSASVNNGVVTLVVSDNGIGFETDYAERIFRVFERLHGRGVYPGTGIGLALCRKIAERHGGTITAEGVLGRGARFTVTLPAEQEASDSPVTGGGEQVKEEPYVAV